MEIDGVFSGGGMKGLAFVGALQVLEEKGYRFKRVAGTSAGAIVAAFIAAGYTAKEIEGLLYEQNMSDLLDRRKSILPIPLLKWFKMYWRMGLYQGVALENWFSDKLAEKGIYTFGDIPEGSLKIVASDLTNGKMIILPDDLKKYGIPADMFPIARALRMSASIPFFFEPVGLRAATGESIIVDGGVLSNFPMWLFDDANGQKERPVIGMRLSHRQETQNGHRIKNALNLFEALFSTMKNAHDERYISREHAKDIMFIPADDFSATNFDLSDEQKATLVQRGRKAAVDFLNKSTPLIMYRAMV